MPFFNKYFILILALLVSLLSTIAFAINYFVYRFPGNNYFPEQMPTIGLILFLAWIGAYLLFDEDSPYVHISRELVYFFLVISVVGFATNAVQLTPFNPIDKQLIAIDSVFFNLAEIIAWTISIPWFKSVLAISYDSLPYQMSYLPFVLILAQKYTYLREYYAMLLLTVLLGFFLYYFLPTMGPASFIKSPYFLKEQYATGVKFAELHRHIPPSTLNGGLIAMPSFHVIWACLCQSLVRCWPIAFVLLLPINLLLIISCVLLGWHYVIDLVGSLIVLLVAYGIYFVTPHVIPSAARDLQQTARI